MKEARFLSQLTNHSMKNVNVIKYIDSFIHKNHLCIVTEFCENGDLHSLIKARKGSEQYFSEDEVMEIFIRCCVASHGVALYQPLL
jgi:serine/threonine protein kinase